MNQLTYWTSWRKGMYLSAAFLLALTIAVGCKKKTSTLGLGALDPEQLLASGGVDTFDLYTYSVREDSVRTDNQQFILLGNYYDPTFGTFSASFYTEYHLGGTLDFNGGTPVLDSAVLSLRYRGYYGKLDQQTFEVYELGDTIYYGTERYKDHSVPLGQLLATSTQTPNTSDSVNVGGDVRPSQLRIHLDNTRFQSFLDHAATVPGDFTSDENFTSYFKGLHVRSTTNPGAGQGGVLYFQVSDVADTRVAIYYKVNGEQFVIELSADAHTADFNHVDIVNSPAVTDVLDNPVSGQTQFYAQAFQSRARIDFPTFDNLPENVIVHNALLVVPVSHQTLGSFYPSGELRAGYKTDDGSIEGFRTIAYDDATKSYIIDLRDYLQDVISGTAENRGVYLYPRFFSATAERIIFNGPNTSNKNKPKLIVKYTEY